jgi:hypothetical protein
MRLLLAFMLILFTLVFVQSERHDCSLRDMSIDNWVLCLDR